MKRFLLCLLSVMFAFSAAGCQAPVSREGINMVDTYFDTVVTIQLWGTADDSLLEHCKELCGQYEQLLSTKITGSEIYQINSAEGRPVEVSDETIYLIKKGLEYGELSQGKFDITIEPLSKLWNFGHNDGEMPDAAAIEEAKSHVNYKNVIIEGNTVTMKDPKAGIDLGGVAKGYIADRLKAYLVKNKVKHGLINLGGNMLAIGTRLDGDNFCIGVQKPFDEQNVAITTLEVNDKSVVSSGSYERYFKKDGKLYHHILNPATGYPFENNLLQVTIESDSSMEGDCLSTTCFALGLEEGTKLIESMKGVKAVFVTDDYELHYAGK